MSTTDATGAFVLANAPGSRKRFPTKPSTGDTICVFDKRDLQLLESRLGLFELRAREIDLREGGLIPGLGVVERLLREKLTLVADSSSDPGWSSPA